MTFQQLQFLWVGPRLRFSCWCGPLWCASFFKNFSITLTDSQLQVRMHIKDGKASLTFTHTYTHRCKYTPLSLSYWITLWCFPYSMRGIITAYPQSPAADYPVCWQDRVVLSALRSSQLCVCVCGWEKHTVFYVCMNMKRKRKDVFCIYVYECSRGGRRKWFYSHVSVLMWVKWNEN